MTVQNQTPASVTTRRAKFGPAPHAVSLGLYDAEIIAMRADGHSTKRIATTIGCGTDLLKKRLAFLHRKSGVPAKPGRPCHPVTRGDYDPVIVQMHANGEDFTRIGAACGCGQTTVRNRLDVLRSAGLAIHGR